MIRTKFGVEKDNVVYIAHSEKEAMGDLRRMGGTLVVRHDSGWVTKA